MRMIEISNGQISIDGIDLSQVSREQIRSRITTIPQDTFTLSGSVRFNLDPTLKIPEDTLWQSLTQVSLSSVVRDGGGLNVKMSELRLSHGQRQLFSLGRALLRKSKILILDEATANIDKDTEATVMRILKEEFKESTVLAVAHRLDTIVDYDRILVLDKGQILEFDSPAELLQRDSVFKELYEKHPSGQ